MKLSSALGKSFSVQLFTVKRVFPSLEIFLLGDIFDCNRCAVRSRSCVFYSVAIGTSYFRFQRLQSLLIYTAIYMLSLNTSQLYLMTTENLKIGVIIPRYWNWSNYWKENTFANLVKPQHLRGLSMICDLAMFFYHGAVVLNALCLQVEVVQRRES